MPASPITPGLGGAGIVRAEKSGFFTCDEDSKEVVLG